MYESPVEEREKQASPLFGVPRDNFSMIMLYLSTRDVCRLMAVSKQTRDMVKDKQTMRTYILWQLRDICEEDQKELKRISEDDTYESMKDLIIAFKKTIKIGFERIEIFGYLTAFFDCFISHGEIFLGMGQTNEYSYDLFKSIFRSKHGIDEMYAFVRRVADYRVKNQPVIAIKHTESISVNEHDLLLAEVDAQRNIIMEVAYAEYNGIKLSGGEIDELLHTCENRLNLYRRCRGERMKDFHCGGYKKMLDSLFKRHLKDYVLYCQGATILGLRERIKVYNNFASRVFKEFNRDFKHNNGVKRIKLQKKIKYFSDSLTKRLIHFANDAQYCDDKEHIGGCLDFFRYIINASGMFTKSFNKFESAPTLIAFYFSDLLHKIDVVVPEGSYYDIISEDIKDLTEVILEHYGHLYSEGKNNEMEYIKKCVEIVKSDRSNDKKQTAAIKRLQTYARLISSILLPPDNECDN